MSTKQNPGPFDCYANAAPDEPMFVLLARDKHAAVLVNLWAAMRRLDGEDEGKTTQAEATADAMVAWLAANRPDVMPVGMRGVSEGLAALAEMVGAVVTIGQQSLEPLAMGNYPHTVNVRPKRGRA